MPATTNIAMNIASPPNAAVTGISVVRVCCSSGYSARPRASPVRTCAAARGGAQARDVEAGAGEHPDRVDPTRMAGQARCLGVGQEDRGLLRDPVAGQGDADDRDRAGRAGGREAQPRAQRAR